MNRHIRQIAVVAALILLIAACGSSESTTDDQAEVDSSTTATPTTLRTTTTTTTTTLPTPTTVVFDRPAESLWDRIQAEEGLSIFAEAVEGAGLVEVLSDCSNDYTVIASNDPGVEMIEQAFGPLITGAISEGDAEFLRGFIEDQMVEGAYDRRGFGVVGSPWVEHTTVAGKKLYAAENDPSTAPGGERRVATNVGSREDFACNGVLFEMTWIMGF